MRASRHNIVNKGRSGQAGLFAVLSLTLLFGALGLAVDVGWAYYTRQSAQAAADAAALAAAAYASASGQPACGTGGVVCNSTATACNNPPTTPATTDLQAGCLYARSNGFVNNGTTQFVSLSANTTAPPGISGNTPSYWVQANVTAKPSTLFGSFGGIKQFTINASATAAVAYYSAGACIYVLNPSASGAFSASGSASVRATCGIFVNSSSSTAFTESGSARVVATQILINGGYSLSGSATVSPTPTTSAGSQADPLAGLVMPTFANSCDHTGYSLSGSGSALLYPGTYCNGITISGSATATFGSGLYIVNGGGINISGSGSISGTDLTFFNTGQYGYTIGSVNLSGSSTVNFTAPSSGTYQGMLFLQDRNLSYSSGNNINGSSSSVLTGTLYFPTTTVTYSGSSTTGSYTAMIAKNIIIAGSADLKNDPTGTYTGLATTVRGLIQ